MTFDVESAAQAMLREGYLLLEPALDPAVVAEIGAALDALRERFGSPPLGAKQPVWLAEGVEVALPGLAFYRLLDHTPQLAGRLLDRRAASVFARIFGESATVEHAGGVLADETRPFTEWENHLGGIDSEAWRLQGLRPHRERVERIAQFVWVDAVEGDGAWRVLPRAVGDPLDPPASIHDPGWPAARDLTGPAGSVLLLDECTWHCVLPRARPGKRRFVGVFGGRGPRPAAGPLSGMLEGALRSEP